MAAFGLLVSVPFMAGCQRPAKVQIPAIEAFEGARTYAWNGSPPTLSRVGDPAGDDRAEAALREELDRELASRGFERVAVAEARFHAAVYLGVQRDSRTLDPFFSVYVAERIERGHALLTLTESFPVEESTWDRSAAPVNTKPAWIGTTESVLRVTERGAGQAELRWTPTDETRNWKLRAIAASLGKRLPE